MIILEKVEIEGFKSIRHMSLDLRALNILIGANGSGKSNFLSFFKLLNYMLTEALQLHVERSGGANAILHYGTKQTTQMSCNLWFTTQSGLNYYHMRLVYGANDVLIFADEQVNFGRTHASKRPPISLGAGHKESKLRLDVDVPQSAVKTSEVIRSLMSQWRFYQFHDTSDESRLKQQASIHDNRVLKADAGNLAAFLYMLKSKFPMHFHRIVSVIGQVAPYFGDFVLEPMKLNGERIILEWKEKNSNNIFSASQLSDGTLRFMALTTLLLQPEPPEMIVIDEPELGLHPYAIRTLATLIKEASSRSQVLVSTQSNSLINYMNPEDVIVVDREDGQSTFRRLNGNNLDDWLKDYSLGELWEKNIFGGAPRV